MAPQDLIDILTECGVSLDNPMLAKAMRARDLLRAARTALSFERFQELVTACPMLLEAVTGAMVVPDFQSFSDELVEVFNQVEQDEASQHGEVRTPHTSPYPVLFAVTLWGADLALTPGLSRASLPGQAGPSKVRRGGLHHLGAAVCLR